MTTTDHTSADFFRKIGDDRDDDTARLAFADWLDEDHPERDAARAEFIRVQCELARREIKLGDRTVANQILARKRAGAPVRWKAKTVATLLARESDLLDAHEARWRRGEVCGRCGGTGHNQEPCDVCGNTPDEDGCIEHGRGCYVINSDGGGTEAADDCPACHGIGYTGSLSATTPLVRTVYDAGVHVANIKDHEWRHPVVWSRGFPASVACNLADAFEGERVTPWAVALMREWGTVERIVLGDCEPEEERGGSHGPLAGKRSYDWRGGVFNHGASNRHDLPMVIHSELRKKKYGGFASCARVEFPTPAAANDALARAVVACARREAEQA